MKRSRPFSTGPESLQICRKQVWFLLWEQDWEKLLSVGLWHASRKEVWPPGLDWIFCETKKHSNLLWCRFFWAFSRNSFLPAAKHILWLSCSFPQQVGLSGYVHLSRNLKKKKKPQSFRSIPKVLCKFCQSHVSVFEERHSHLKINIYLYIIATMHQ